MDVNILSRQLGYRIHTNRELGLMLSGIKPLAVFSDVNDFIPVVSRYIRMFDRHVVLGHIVRQDYFEYSNKHSMKIVVAMFANPGEEWRFEAMRSLRNLDGPWTIERETQLGNILGYTEDQNDIWIRYLKNSDNHSWARPRSGGLYSTCSRRSPSSSAV